MKDEFRKPMPGMWYALEKIFEQDGVTIGTPSSYLPQARSTGLLRILDKEQSYYVGDAAGRVYSKTKKDFASTDRKWALNLDLKFFTPEEYFLGLNPNTTFELPGFNVSTLPQRMSLPLPSSFNLPIPPHHIFLSPRNPPNFPPPPSTRNNPRTCPLCRLPESWEDFILPEAL
jgi:bifunctional polynucleotide phosphatase/kinase